MKLSFTTMRPNKHIKRTPIEKKAQVAGKSAGAKEAVAS